MIPSDSFDRHVSDWLHEDAEHRVPEHLDAVLRRTRTERQRPAWSSLERWLPVQTTLRLAPVPRLAWLLVVFALVVGLVIAAFAIGSRQRLPAPFGPARNGPLLTSADGDIWAVNSTGARKALIAAPEFDFGTNFSRDGTKFMFLRARGGTTPEDGLALGVANADGSGVRVLSPYLQGLDWQDWSPDSTRIAFLSRPNGASGPGVINVVNVDGTGLRTLDVGRPAHDVSWLPPDGKEIIFRGEQLVDTDPPVGIFAVRPDGTGLREVSTRPPVDSYDFQSIAVSPDGTRLVYRASGDVFRIHVLDLQTGAERTLPDPTGSTAQVDPIFSPDGRSVVYQRWIGDSMTQLVVAPADGSGTGIAIGPPSAATDNGPSLNNYTFTPDGTAVITGDGEDVTRLVPVDGSPSRILSTGRLSFAAYQRLAP
jgi:WD40 repeat protein